MTKDRLRDFAERYTAAWCSQDAAGVAAFYAADGSLKVNDGAPAVGRRAIADLAQSFMTAFPDLRVTLNEVAAQGDRTRYHWTLAGTNPDREARATPCASAASRSGGSETTG